MKELMPTVKDTRVWKKPFKKSKKRGEGREVRVQGASASIRTRNKVVPEGDREGDSAGGKQEGKGKFQEWERPGRRREVARHPIKSGSYNREG